MTRHILAFLALLSGLAAFGSPAQASLSEALACGSSIAAAAGDQIAANESVSVQRAPATISASRAIEVPRPLPAKPESLRLPVLMGIERAFE